MQTPEPSWQRLPLVALIFFFLKTLQQLVKQGYQMIPAVVSIWFFVEPVRDWLIVAVLFLPLFLLFGAGLSYWRFSYQITAERIRVRQGVLKRLELSLDLDRVQQADLQFPWYLRPFKLRVVRLESAGSKGQEVELAGLTLVQAEAIQAFVQAQKMKQAKQQQDQQTSLVDEQDGATPADFSLQQPLAEILKIGIMQNPLFVATFALGFLFSNEWVREQIEQQLQQFVGDEKNTLVLLLLASATLVLLLFLATLGSVLFATNRYLNYHLQRFGDRYSYTAGALSPLQRSFTVRKLQGVKRQQRVLARLLQRYSIELAQAGEASSKKERFLVPVLSQPQVHDLFQDLQIPSQVSWAKYHPWFMARWLVIPSVTVGFLISIWAGLVAIPLLLLVNSLRWQQAGWFFNGQWLSVRYGFLGRVETWLPAPKMQFVRWQQGPIQKLLGIGHLSIGSAAATYRLPDLPQATALALQEQLVRVTRQCSLRWM